MLCCKGIVGILIGICFMILLIVSVRWMSCKGVDFFMYMMVCMVLFSLFSFGWVWFCMMVRVLVSCVVLMMWVLE